MASPGGHADDLDRVIEENHRAVDTFVKGDHEPLHALYSERDDISLANPFGPAARGPEQVADTLRRAAALYRDGRATGFELVSKVVTTDLAYTVENESFEVQFVGRDEVTSMTLRVTTVYRREEGGWKQVHRHADPITTARGPESIVQD